METAKPEDVGWLPSIEELEGLPWVRDLENYRRSLAGPVNLYGYDTSENFLRFDIEDGVDGPCSSLSWPPVKKEYIRILPDHSIERHLREGSIAIYYNVGDSPVHFLINDELGLTGNIELDKERFLNPGHKLKILPGTPVTLINMSNVRPSLLLRHLQERDDYISLELANSVMLPWDPRSHERYNEKLFPVAQYL